MWWENEIDRNVRRGAAGLGMVAMLPNPMRRLHILPALLLLLPACERDVPDLDAPPPTLRRLTTAQYANAVHDVFGDAVVVPAQLEPDVNLDGFYSIGAALTSISPRGVEQYEEAASAIAQQVMEPGFSDLDCDPVGATDRTCAQGILEGVARRAWSRPVTAEEGDVLTGLGTDAASVVGDFDDGLEYGIAAILQSPHFPYRDNLTHDEPGDQPWVHAITGMCLEEYRYLVEALRSVQEGDGTLLDSCVVLGTTEISLGRTHSLEDMPILLAGSACGRLETDLHYRSATAESSTKVLLSVIRAKGINRGEHGIDDTLVTEGLGAIEI